MCDLLLPPDHKCSAPWFLFASFEFSVDFMKLLNKLHFTEKCRWSCVPKSKWSCLTRSYIDEMRI